MRSSRRREVVCVKETIEVGGGSHNYCMWYQNTAYTDRRVSATRDLEAVLANRNFPAHQQSPRPLQSKSKPFFPCLPICLCEGLGRTALIMAVISICRTFHPHSLSLVLTDLPNLFQPGRCRCCQRCRRCFPACQQVAQVPQSFVTLRHADVHVLSLHVLQSTYSHRTMPQRARP